MKLRLKNKPFKLFFPSLLLLLVGLYVIALCIYEIHAGYFLSGRREKHYPYRYNTHITVQAYPISFWVREISGLLAGSFLIYAALKPQTVAKQYTQFKHFQTKTKDYINSKQWWGKKAGYPAGRNAAINQKNSSASGGSDSGWQGHRHRRHR